MVRKWFSKGMTHLVKFINAIWVKYINTSTQLGGKYGFYFTTMDFWPTIQLIEADFSDN